MIQLSIFMLQWKRELADAGRNGAYNATRKVIDDEKFMNNSQDYVKTNILDNLNAHVIETCKNIENQTGREIYINNIPITNYTRTTFTANDVNITQEDPFGFYINIKAGIPIKVIQRDQVYEGKTPKLGLMYPLKEWKILISG